MKRTILTGRKNAGHSALNAHLRNVNGPAIPDVKIRRGDSTDLMGNLLSALAKIEKKSDTEINRASDSGDA